MKDPIPKDLFDILACPIDKFFPLEMFIFTFETNESDFLKYFNEYEKRNIKSIEEKKIIEISKEKDETYIKDLVIIENTPLQKYIESIIKSIKEFNHIHNRSSNKASIKCFNIIKNEINSKLIQFSTNLFQEKIENLIPELLFINRIKIFVEIASGLLFCPECKRWYPIIETIPQMLPDEYRDKEKELDFLRTNKNLLDKEFLNQELKPFHIQYE